ncbi:MAG: hypothetical protein ACSHX8_03090 [Opitutaceae bacterium]
MKKSVAMKWAAGLTLAFSALLWLYIQKETSNNPGYMFPAWHLLYPWLCVTTLFALSTMIKTIGYFAEKENLSDDNETHTSEKE